MNREEHPLDRLLRSAARAPQPVRAALPFGQETRIRAAWRSERSAGEENRWLGWLRNGFAVACVLVLVSAGVSWSRTATRETDVWAASNVVINLASLP